MMQWLQRMGAMLAQELRSQIYLRFSSDSNISFLRVADNVFGFVSFNKLLTFELPVVD